jgi:hypothetical protein
MLGLRGLFHGKARIGLTLTAVGIAILFLISATGLIPRGAASEPTGLRSGSGAPAAESVVCASLVTNASLNSTYNSIYFGLPTEFQNWTPGPNSSTPTNQSEYPNVTAGDQQLDDVWIAICGGTVFTTLYDDWGPDAFSSGFQYNGSTGDYQTDYGFIWHANCTNSSWAAHGPCEFIATWYVDIVTGNIDGPLYQEMSGGGLGGPPRVDFVLGAITNTSAAGRYVYSDSLTYVAAGSTVAQIGFEVKTSWGCAAVSRITAIEVRTANGTILAWERNSSNWGEGATSALLSGDRLAILSNGSLVGDELDAAYNGSDEIGFPIAGAGEWAGCDFSPDFPVGVNFADPSGNAREVVHQVRGSDPARESAVAPGAVAGPSVIPMIWAATAATGLILVGVVLLRRRRGRLPP